MSRIIGRKKGDETGELSEIGRWSKKAQAAKGGTVNHHVRCGHIKKACGCYMGSRGCNHEN